jgi:hypothetical protein
VSTDGPEVPADIVPGLPTDEGELRETVGSLVPTTLPPAGELPVLPTPPPPTLPTTTEGANPLGLP